MFSNKLTNRKILFQMQKNRSHRGKKHLRKTSKHVENSSKPKKKHNDIANTSTQTNLQACSIVNRQFFPLWTQFSHIRFILESGFGSVVKAQSDNSSESFAEDTTSLLVSGRVKVTKLSQSRAVLNNGDIDVHSYLIIEWNCTLISDIVADCVIAFILQSKHFLKQFPELDEIHDASHSFHDDYARLATSLHLFTEALRLHFEKQCYMNEDSLLATLSGVDGSICPDIIT